MKKRLVPDSPPLLFNFQEKKKFSNHPTAQPVPPPTFCSPIPPPPPHKSPPEKDPFPKKPPPKFLGVNGSCPRRPTPFFPENKSLLGFHRVFLHNFLNIFKSWEKTPPIRFLGNAQAVFVSQKPSTAGPPGGPGGRGMPPPGPLCPHGFQNRAPVRAFFGAPYPQRPAHFIPPPKSPLETCSLGQGPWVHGPKKKAPVDRNVPFSWAFPPLERNFFF